MRVQVKRVIMTKWRKIVRDRGLSAEFIDVPATNPGVQFKGIYTDDSKSEVAVAWPLDRPQDAQEDFAKTVCMGAWPVDAFNRKVERNALSPVEENNEKHRSNAR